MSPASAGVDVEIEGRELKVSNLDKVLYPEAGFTKGQVIDYYTRISPVLLPHLKRRPLTLKRYPNGVSDKFFYEKNCPNTGRRGWRRRPSSAGATRPWTTASATTSPPSSGWPTWPPWSFTRRSRGRPRSNARPCSSSTSTRGRRRRCWSAARWHFWCGTCSTTWVWSRSPRHRARRACSCTSRSTRRSPTTTPSRSPSARQDAGAEHPKLVLSVMKKELRTGKMFIDWSQNDEHKTTVSAYSLRARARRQYRPR